MAGDRNAFFDAQQRKRDFAASELDFMRSEIALGMTFLDVADATGISETRRRNRANAQKAHDEVVRRMADHAYETEAERHGLEAALLPLTRRLKAFP